DRFAGGTVHNPENQVVLRADLRNGALQYCGAVGAVADFTGELGSQAGVGRLLHHAKRLLNLLVGDEVQEGRLVGLNGEAFAQCAVENYVAGGVSEVGKDDGVTVRQGVDTAKADDGCESGGDHKSGKNENAPVALPVGGDSNRWRCGLG